MLFFLFWVNSTDSFFCLADLSLLQSNKEQALVPPNKSMGDIEELAASYERKLIEVSAVFLFIYLFFSFTGVWFVYIW